EAVRQQPTVDLRYRTRVDSIDSTGPLGVEATCTDLTTGEQFRLRSDFLVACDGINSGIRQQLGIEREGDTVLDYRMSILFHVDDLLGQLGREPGERFILLDERGARGNVTSIDGDDVWRLLVRGMG